MVEDNRINQKVIQQQLIRIGCASVTVCDHGQQALEALEKTALRRGNSSDAPKLSIVLLDVEMPVMDGLTCVKKIREMEKRGELVRRVPVIALTANARQQQIEAAVGAGMDEVIVSFSFLLIYRGECHVTDLFGQTKPFTIPALVGRIETLAIRW